MTEDPKTDMGNGNDGFVWSTNEGIVSGASIPEKPIIVVKPPKPEKPKSSPPK